MLTTTGLFFCLLFKISQLTSSSVDWFARASEDFRFEEIRYRTSCGWFPVGGWWFPVWGWGHVTCISQSEARDSKMAALICIFDLSLAGF